MPVLHTAAVFEPIPPDLDLGALVESTDSFEYAPRVSCDVIDSYGIEQFEKLVLLHVVISGKPLVVEGFQTRLDIQTFSTQWLRDNVGTKGEVEDINPDSPLTVPSVEYARDLAKGADIPLSISHYLSNMEMLANQWNQYNYKLPKQRLYLKDIDCPDLWQNELKDFIPPSLFYLNECSGKAAGSARPRKSTESSRPGDLMSCLPPAMRAENMMCYIGHEGTYTPAHREMCASLGQNIMVEASGSVTENGIPTKPGSSIWFMTESKDRHLLAEYWLSTLGHDIEVESHFAGIEAWARAPFKVYIVEQKVGDFVLIPPLAPHQVWNRGTRTMKVAWNRTTVETLEMAMSEALPRARMVCRDEQYKNKAIILFSLNRYSAILKNIDYQKSMTRDQDKLMELTGNSNVKRLYKDFMRLFQLFNEIMLSESFSPKLNERKVELLPFDSNVTCSYCRCNIFNRFLTCKTCVLPLDDGTEDTYDICMECYAMGRSCHCISKLSWVEQFPWKDLLRKHEIWRRQLLHLQEGQPSKFPLFNTFDERHQGFDRKTLAEVCQEQLRTRPFFDIRRSDHESKGDLHNDKNDDDDEPRSVRITLRKKPKKMRSEKWQRENLPCHVCCWRHPKWKMAVCECGTAYCYGSLWRGFDTMPQTIMEDPYWRCPKCQEICNCSSCRKRPRNEPYQPNSTILGHDTRKFADTRSIEALVDFSCSNSHWLKKAGENVAPFETRRMQKRILEAQQAKSQHPVLDEDDDGPERELSSPEHSSSVNGEVPIDPLLVGPKFDNTTDLDERGHPYSARNCLNNTDSLSRLDQVSPGFVSLAQLEYHVDDASSNQMHS